MRKSQLRKLGRFIPCVRKTRDRSRSFPRPVFATSPTVTRTMAESSASASSPSSVVGSPVFIEEQLQPPSFVDEAIASPPGPPKRPLSPGSPGAQTRSPRDLKTRRKDGAFLGRAKAGNPEEKGGGVFAGSGRKFTEDVELLDRSVVEDFRKGECLFLPSDGTRPQESFRFGRSVR